MISKSEGPSCRPQGLYRVHVKLRYVLPEGSEDHEGFTCRRPRA